MQFGWLTLAHSPSPEDDHAAIDEQLDAGVLRRDGGLRRDLAHRAQLHGRERLLRSDPVRQRGGRAHVARSASASRCIQLALRHPIRLATQLALLDNLAGGRLDVGVGRGTNYNEYEFVGYGLRSDDSRERMAEALEVMTRAWTEAPLVHHGQVLPG